MADKPEKFADIKPPGRPFLTPEKIADLVKYLEQGHFRETACNLAGISVSSLHYWMKCGEAVANLDPAILNSRRKPISEIQRRHMEFYYTVLSIEAAAEDHTMQELLSAARESGDWRGLAWVMERRYPEKWGRKQVQPQSGMVIAAEGRIVIADGSKENYLESLRQAREGLVDQTVGVTPPKAISAPVEVTPEVTPEVVPKPTLHLAAKEGKPPRDPYDA